MLTDLIIQYCENCDTILALGPLAMAGISAAANMALNAANQMIGGAIGQGQSEAQTKRQYIWNKYQNTYLREWAHEDRDEQRRYDLPINERNRWSLAGYNPQAVFGQFSQSQPTMPNYTNSGPGALVQPNMPPIEIADITNKLADTKLKHAQASRENAEEDAIRGEETRKTEMQPYLVRYQDALATLTTDANHRAEVQQQMEADMDAATRNKMQADIDATIDGLRLQDEAQKEIARHNLETEALARYEAETNRIKAKAEAAESAARARVLTEQFNQLHKQGLIDYNPKYGYLFPVPSGIATADLKRNLPKEMTGLVTVINGKSYIQLSNALAEVFRQGKASELENAFAEMINAKQGYENRHKSAQRVYGIISGFIPFASGVAAGSGTQLIRGAQQPKRVKIHGF